MAVISKADLKFDYKWSADKGDNPKLTGSPDRDLIDRDEGYEVLRYLNAVSKTKATALKAERLIKQHLPGSVRSRARITEWLQQNWSNY